MPNRATLDFSSGLQGQCDRLREICKRFFAKFRNGKAEKVSAGIQRRDAKTAARRSRNQRTGDTNSEPEGPTRIFTNLTEENETNEEVAELWQGRIMGTHVPPPIPVSIILPCHDSAGLLRPLKKSSLPACMSGYCSAARATPSNATLKSKGWPTPTIQTTPSTSRSAAVLFGAYAEAVGQP